MTQEILDKFKKAYPEMEQELSLISVVNPPKRRSRWVLDDNDHCHCSACKFGRNIETQIGWTYCPNCGAKMDLED